MVGAPHALPVIQPSKPALKTSGHGRGSRLRWQLSRCTPLGRTRDMIMSPNPIRRATWKPPRETTTPSRRPMSSGRSTPYSGAAGAARRLPPRHEVCLVTAQPPRPEGLLGVDRCRKYTVSRATVYTRKALRRLRFRRLTPISHPVDRLWGCRPRSTRYTSLANAGGPSSAAAPEHFSHPGAELRQERSVEDAPDLSLSY